VSRTSPGACTSRPSIEPIRYGVPDTQMRTGPASVLITRTRTAEPAGATTFCSPVLPDTVRCLS
jgi:hypothetical protein